MLTIPHKFTAAAVAIVSIACTPGFAKEEAKIERLPALVSAESWKAPGGNSVQLLAWPNYLGLQLNLKEKETTRLLLKQPIALPEWTTGLTFTLGSDGIRPMSFLLRVLLRDARGGEYAYKVSSPSIKGRENYIIAESMGAWASMRLTLPGLSRQAFGTSRDANIEVLVKPKGQPEKSRLDIVGLEIITAKPGEGKVYVGNFTASQVTPLTSQLYYALDGNEGFGEVDGLPSLSLGRFGMRYGEQYRLAWTVRDRFDGQPFLSGEKTFLCDRNDPAYALNLAQRIQLPIAEKGVYWIKVRRFWSNKKAEDPEKVTEYDIRLDVLKGKEPVKRTALKGPIPGTPIQIGPDRASAIFRDGEARKLKVEFACPALSGSYGYRIQTSTFASGAVVKTAEGELAGTQAVEIPLDELKPGAYRVHAELLRNGKLIDLTDRLVGIVSKEGSVVTQPDPKADWRKLTSGKSLAYVGMSKGELKIPAERVAKVKTLLDEGCNLSKVAEYETRWSDLEPIPGVYDWSELDEVVAYAGQKGMTVLLWPTFIGGEPEWIPPYFQQLKDGSITGATSYKFQGGRINFWQNPEIKQKLINLFNAMVLRYRGNPAVHGYYFLAEHGGDQKWSGFFSGYEPETMKDYREFCQTKFSTIEALNKRWGTQLASWNQISVPPSGASERQQVDWMAFREGRLGEFFIDAVRNVRKLDPYKLMMLYTGSVNTESVTELQKMGIILADGGAAVPEAGGPTSMGYAAQGVGRRTEEISVGNWSAAFPTQLDATLFNLTLGGGVNANCKMFFRPGKPFADLRKPPMSLDRFEKFIPIWSELAKTQPMPRQSYILKQGGGTMLTTYSSLFQSDQYTNLATFDAHLLCPSVPMSIAKQGKIIFLPGRVESFETGLIDQVVDYVKNGGTVAFAATVSRRSMDLPGEDWVLLKRLGIAPPTEELLGMANAVPASDAGFGADASSFKLNQPLRFAQQEAKVLATFEKDGSPAVTRHAVGKGFVNVIWANEILPPTENGGYPFFRDLARQAGVTTYCDSDVPRIWTNLLANPENGSFYGTVYHATGRSSPEGPVSGKTFWTLPAGNYEVTELISGRSLGVKSASELAKTGLPTTIERKAVDVYRFAKK